MNLMLCKSGSVEDLRKRHLTWIGQRKIDGVRCVAIAHEGRVKLLSRSGTDITRNFMEVAREISARSVVYDGAAIVSLHKTMPESPHTFSHHFLCHSTREINQRSI